VGVLVKHDLLSFYAKHLSVNLLLIPRLLCLPPFNIQLSMFEVLLRKSTVSEVSPDIHSIIIQTSFLNVDPFFKLFLENYLESV